MRWVSVNRRGLVRSQHARSHCGVVSWHARTEDGKPPKVTPCVACYRQPPTGCRRMRRPRWVGLAEELMRACQALPWRFIERPPRLSSSCSVRRFSIVKHCPVGPLHQIHRHTHTHTHTNALIRPTFLANAFNGQANLKNYEQTRGK